MGWKIDGTINPEIRKCVIAIVPHTSWTDFLIGLFARGIIGLEMHYVAKKELFRFPFGWYFRWMGGSPIDRSGSRNRVDEIVGLFRAKQVFRLAIAPEGTRKKVGRLKTGFYYIALEAGVPIIPVAFDYRAKTVIISIPVIPKGNIAAELPAIESLFSGIPGRYPENSFTRNVS